MNVRLSSQFSREHLKLSNVHGKIGKKALNSFCQRFLVHSFPSHLCDPIYRFVHTYYYQIIFGIFFYVHGSIGPKYSLQFPQQRKFLTAEISLQRIQDSFYSKQVFIQDLLLQKVLINKFLEHNGMRVFSSALFSFCMIGYAMMITLS